MNIKWSYLGIISYMESQKLMQRLRKKIHEGDRSDYILMLQHRAVITRGLSEKDSDMGLKTPREELQKMGIPIIDSDRGGKITLHNPGQLVGYFVMDLKRHNYSIKHFVRDLMEVIREVLESYDIQALSNEKNPGLYVNQEKIAFIGLNVKQNITNHGFALNVNNDLGLFDLFVPCGDEDARITSMEKLGGKCYSIFDVYWRFITYFADIIGDEMEEIFIEDFNFE